MKDAGLIFLWGALILMFLGGTFVDGRLRQEIDQLHARLSAVESR